MIEQAPPQLHLLRLLQGMWLARLIHVAADLGIADTIAEGDKSADELAVELHLDPNALARVLKCLATNGVFQEIEGRFRNTELSATLRSEVQGSIRPLARLYGRPWQLQSWRFLKESVTYGKSGVEIALGESVWSYLSDTPDEELLYENALGSISTFLNPSLLRAYDYSIFDSIVDVGGGDGSFLRAILDAHPQLRGTLYERKPVIDSSVDGGAVSTRLTLRTGDFLSWIPPNADAYLLKQVLHDWSDDQALTILRCCREAMHKGSQLLLFEFILPEESTAEAAGARLMDVLMLVVHGGRERTRRELESLLSDSGLTICDIRSTGTPMSLIVAERGRFN